MMASEKTRAMTPNLIRTVEKYRLSTASRTMMSMTSVIQKTMIHAVSSVAWRRVYRTSPTPSSVSENAVS